MQLALRPNTAPISPSSTQTLEKVDKARLRRLEKNRLMSDENHWKKGGLVVVFGLFCCCCCWVWGWVRVMMVVDLLCKLFFGELVEVHNKNSLLLKLGEQRAVFFWFPQASKQVVRIGIWTHKVFVGWVGILED